MLSVGQSPPLLLAFARSCSSNCTACTFDAARAPSKSKTLSGLLAKLAGMGRCHVVIAGAPGAATRKCMAPAPPLTCCSKTSRSRRRRRACMLGVRMVASGRRARSCMGGGGRGGSARHHKGRVASTLHGGVHRTSDMPGQVLSKTRSQPRVAKYCSSGGQKRGVRGHWCNVGFPSSEVAASNARGAAAGPSGGHTHLRGRFVFRQAPFPLKHHFDLQRPGGRQIVGHDGPSSALYSFQCT